MDTPGHSDPDALLAHAGRLRRLARSLVLDRDLADDLTQETLLAALRTGPRDPGALWAWLSAVLGNLRRRAARGALRQRAREDAVARGDALPSGGELAARAEGLRRVMAVVLDLDEPYRSTVLLRFLEERTPTEIAALQGVPVATVKTRLARARAQLRARLEGPGGVLPAWLLAFGQAERSAPALPWPAIPSGAVLMGSKIKLVAATLAAAVVLVVGWSVLHDGEPAAPLPGEDAARADAQLAALDQGLAADAAPAAGVRRPVTPQAPGPVDGASDDAPGPATAVLGGRVVDAQDRPLAAVMVRLVREPGATFQLPVGADLGPAVVEQERRTGADGRFAFEVPVYGPRTLRAVAEGYAPRELAERYGGEEVRIVLEPAARLTGRVVRASDGRGVSGGVVQVYRRSGGYERVPLGPDGGFELTDLAAGAVGLLAVPREEAAGRYSSVTVEAGGIHEVELSVRDGLVVRGRVTAGDTGQGIAGAEVSAHSFLWKTSRADAQGFYEIVGVEPERAVTLVARAPGYGKGELRLKVEQRDTADLVLFPGRTARGRVVGEAGQPLAGARVLASAVSEEAGTLRTDAVSTRSGDDGRFELVDLRSDAGHRLWIQAAGHAVFLAPMGDGPGSPPDLDLGTLRLEAEATLVGRLVDSEDQPHAAWIGLSYRGDPQAGMLGERQLRAGADGRFLAAGLAAGPYVLSAAPSGRPALRGFELELSPGEDRELTVRLPGDLAIAGVVRDAQGRGLAGVQVGAVPADGTAGWSRGRTDELGAFKIEGLSPGVYTVAGSVSELGRRLGSFRRTDVPAGELALEIELQDEVVVRGRVVDADGVAVPFPYVWSPRGDGAPNDGVRGDEQGRFELSLAAVDKVVILARRTEHLSASSETPQREEVVVGRRILPASAGEARYEGAIPESGLLMPFD